ncbi:MAG TPA: DUF2935 domain-containing protein [Firmicutes bacterium]|nr:DUF2935 domain-containing protein [Bacillota bacterium]
MTYWEAPWGCPPDGNQQLLDEARFWVQIMREHALFIQLGLPGCDTELIRGAQAFAERFQRLEEMLDEAVGIGPELLTELRQAVREFVQYKQRLLRASVQCQLGGGLFPLLIDHITREAVRFLNRLEREQPITNPGFQELTQEEVFWLRIMKEHLEFIIHLLDPSERALINTAEDLKNRVATLLETARDLNSMSRAQPATFPTLGRFSEEVLSTIVMERDFKAAAYELALNCQVLSIVPTPLLLDHVRREADRALEEISALLNNTLTR